MNDGEFIKLFLDLTGRAPTHTDRERITKMIGALPQEVLRSPTINSAIIILADHQFQLASIISETRQQAEAAVRRDMPHSMNFVVQKACDAIAERLPIDPHGTMARLGRWGVALAVTCCIVGAAGGALLHVKIVDSVVEAQVPASEEAFANCVNAALGRAFVASRSSHGQLADPAALVAEVRQCAGGHAFRLRTML
jgi:hypothetical protein